MSPQEAFERTMREFEEGKLTTDAGEPLTDKDAALAAAYARAKQIDPNYGRKTVVGKGR